MQVGGDGGPPYWEVLLDGVTQVGAVWRRLAYYLVERLTSSLPGLCLHAHESSNGQGNWQSQSIVDSDASHHWSKNHVAGEPGEGSMSNKLSGQLLQLPVVQLLHSEDLVVGQVIVVDVGEPIPVLRRRNSANLLVSSVEVLVKCVRVWIEFLLHGHDEQ